jgi:hypothetical protein
MNINGKKVLGLALAGLIAGATLPAIAFAGEQHGDHDHSENGCNGENGCSGEKDSCNGKDSCDGKDSCGGKDGCEGK